MNYDPRHSQQLSVDAVLDIPEDEIYMYIYICICICILRKLLGMVGHH